MFLLNCCSKDVIIGLSSIFNINQISIIWLLEFCRYKSLFHFVFIWVLGPGWGWSFCTILRWWSVSCAIFNLFVVMHLMFIYISGSKVFQILNLLDFSFKVDWIKLFLRNFCQFLSCPLWGFSSKGGRGEYSFFSLMWTE